MTRRTKWLAVSCALLVGAATLWSIRPSGEAAGASERRAFAKPSNMGPMRGPLGRYLFLISFLDLTDEQRETIAAIVKSRRDEVASAAAAISQKRRALRQAVLSEYVNEEEIRRAANELGKAIGDATVLASDVLKEVRQVLTPEQIEKIKSFREERDNALEWLREMAVSPRKELSGSGPRGRAYSRWRCPRGRNEMVSQFLSLKREDCHQGFTRVWGEPERCHILALTRHGI